MEAQAQPFDPAEAKEVLKTMGFEEAFSLDDYETFSFMVKPGRVLRIKVLPKSLLIFMAQPEITTLVGGKLMDYVQGLIRRIYKSPRP